MRGRASAWELASSGPGLRTYSVDIRDVHPLCPYVVDMSRLSQDTQTYGSFSLMSKR